MLFICKHSSIFIQLFRTLCKTARCHLSVGKRIHSPVRCGELRGTKVNFLSTSLVQFVPSIYTAYLSTTKIMQSINFQDYDVYGFDLDHTLAKYKLVELFNLAYDCVATFLVNERGYDPSIKGDMHKYKDFVCKGLFLDIKQGNILKLGHDTTILRASHGTSLLSVKQIQAVYGKDMKWEAVTNVKNTLKNGISEYRFFENYFDCPGLVAIARAIDIIDQQSSPVSTEEKEKMYIQIWTDVMDSLLCMYNLKNFSTDKSRYFSAVKCNPERFVEKCSQDIRCWLKSLKQQDKIVFLLTSSQIDYAGCLLDVCLGKDWPSYFDISLFRGRKPGFFAENNPFYNLEGADEQGIVTDLQRNGCYSQGNLKEFNRFLASQLGKEKFKVLFFGDNLCADCYPSKHYAKWSTVLVLEEMDAEGYLCSDGTVPGHESDAEKCAHDSPAKKHLLEHSSLVTTEEAEYLLTDMWGPFLIESTIDSNRTQLQMNTFWGDVISRYSDIAVPSLEYLARVPLDHNYICFTGESGNTDGFHPGRPSSLLP